MDGFSSAPVDEESPAVALVKRPADAAAITPGLFAAPISSQVQTALWAQRLFFGKRRETETPQIVTASPTAFFSASALFRINVSYVLYFLVLFYSRA